MRIPSNSRYSPDVGVGEDAEPHGPQTTTQGHSLPTQGHSLPTLLRRKTSCGTDSGVEDLIPNRTCFEVRASLSRKNLTNHPDTRPLKLRATTGTSMAALRSLLGRFPDASTASLQTTPSPFPSEQKCRSWLVWRFSFRTVS